jgi:hypothetical protein
MKELEEAVGTKQEADERGADETIVTPLWKRRLGGELYERDPKAKASSPSRRRDCTSSCMSEKGILFSDT